VVHGGYGTSNASRIDVSQQRFAGELNREEGPVVKVTIRDDRIDISDIPLHNTIEWDPILEELAAEPLPSMLQKGRHMAVNFLPNGKLHAYIYRTDKTPSDAKVREILKRYGIE
jgi:hypothetical protein